MHFSIPNTSHRTVGNQAFITYNIHINGTYHCSLRYRQLYQFYIQLRKLFGEKTLAEFPPKKLFKLSTFQLEERRSQLEKFLQIASQDSRIVQSRLFNGFLLAAQQESFQHHFASVDNEHSSSRSNSFSLISSSNPSLNQATIHNDTLQQASLEIYQANWHSTTLSVTAAENSDVILSQFCRELKLEPSHVPYFGLFLVQRIDNDYHIVRPLDSYESPLLTLKWINKLYSNKSLSTTASSSSSSSTSATTATSPKSTFVIIVRKSYWNSILDEDLFNERSALNMLYWQALHEIEKGHVLASRETRNRLTALQAKGDKVEYLRIARTLRHYGHIFFDEAYCDYPCPKTPIRMCAGNFELCFKMVTTQDEISFRVIRIKCWRLTTITPGEDEHCDNENSANTNRQQNRDAPATVSDDHYELELSFEYLVAKGQLKWITIRSKQAVLLSLTLQSMVDEMLFQKSGKIRNKNDSTNVLLYNTSPSYSSQTAMLVNGNTNPTGNGNNGTAPVKSPQNERDNADNGDQTDRETLLHNDFNRRMLGQICCDDWKFVKSDGNSVESKNYRLFDDQFNAGSKVIQIDNRCNTIHYNPNLVFNDIADDDL